jgi:hypothetical protein
MTTNDLLPDISKLGTEELLALREAIDARLEDVRSAFIDQAQRLGLVVSNGKKKRRGRAPKVETAS